MKKYGGRRPVRRMARSPRETNRPMRKFKKRGPAKRIASLLALLVVFAGLGLVGYALLDENSPISRVVNPPEAPAAPKDTDMKLTIPKMARVDNLAVRTTPVSDESALETGAQHVEGTGFPWQEVANVDIAGHRLGYPGTDSYLVFWDLNKLRNGDKVIVTASDGTKYTYSVFDRFVIGPYDAEILQPTPGANIVTLQTCTLPDDAERLIVQAELVKVA